jgi:hypothetical protein
MAYNAGSGVQMPIWQAEKSNQLPNTGQLATGIGALQSIANNNTAASAMEAEKLREWQVQQAQIARDYNTAEARKNRDWQERMSNTAHQREVRDLIAAGLNPVLSVTGGSGSAVTSGATASTSSPNGSMGSVDTSGTGAVAGLLSSFLSSMMSLEATRVSAQSNQAVADKYTAMSKYTSELQAQTQLDTANIQAAATRYVSDQSLAGTKYASDQSAAAAKVAASIHASAAKYGYDVNAMTTREVAAFNAEVNKELQEAGFRHEFDIKEAFPNNAWNALGDLITDAKHDIKNVDLPWGNNIIDYFGDLAGRVKDFWTKRSKNS